MRAIKLVILSTRFSQPDYWLLSPCDNELLNVTTKNCQQGIGHICARVIIETIVFCFTNIHCVVLRLRVCSVCRAELKKKTKKPGGGGEPTEVSGSASAISFSFCSCFFSLFYFFPSAAAGLWRGGPLRTSSTWRVGSAALAEASSNGDKPPYGPKGPGYRQFFAILGTKWMYTVVSLEPI